MTRTTMLALFIGSALLLPGSGATAAEAERGGFTMAPHFMAPHFSAPHFSAQRAAPVARLGTNRPIGSRRFLSHPGFGGERPDHRLDRRRLANRFGAPFSGFAPFWGFWPDEAMAPATPEVPAYGQPADNGSGSEDTGQVPVAGSDMGSTVLRHDFPGYTVFDYCRVPPRDLKDCGPEWIVMHPVAAAPLTPPAAGEGK